jgi:hypothetical protein
MTDNEAQEGLFTVHGMHVQGGVGRTEQLLERTVEWAEKAGHLTEEDGALVGAARVAARALDAAEKLGGKSPYAVASVLTPYRELLAALRLPADSNGGKPAGGIGAQAEEWMARNFGTPS